MTMLEIVDLAETYAWIALQQRIDLRDVRIRPGDEQAEVLVGDALFLRLVQYPMQHPTRAG